MTNSQNMQIKLSIIEEKGLLQMLLDINPYVRFIGLIGRKENKI